MRKCDGAKPYYRARTGPAPLHVTKRRVGGQKAFLRMPSWGAAMWAPLKASCAIGGLAGFGAARQPWTGTASKGRSRL